MTSNDLRMAGLRCGGRSAKGCLIMYDRATGYVDAKPIGSKEAQEIKLALKCLRRKNEDNASVLRWMSKHQGSSGRTEHRGRQEPCRMSTVQRHCGKYGPHPDCRNSGNIGGRWTSLMLLAIRFGSLLPLTQHPSQKRRKHRCVDVTHTPVIGRPHYTVWGTGAVSTVTN